MSTEELQSLAAAARDAFTDRHPLESGSVITAAGSGAPGWATLVDLGLTGLGIGEDSGGAAEQAVVLTEAARVLLPAPLLASTVALALLPAGHPLLQQISDGAARVTVAWSGTDAPAALFDPAASRLTVADGTLTGEARLVLDLRDATDVLVLTTDGLFHVAVDGPGVSVRERSTVDVTRSLDDLVLTGAAATLVTTEPDAAAARRALRLGVAAEAVGVASRCVEMAIAHARVREAFGRPIGVHQAIAHPLVEAYADVELARSSVSWAASLVDVGDPLADAAAAAACVTATQAAVDAAERTVQVLGGIGFTWEHVTHRLYKRSLGLLQLAGSHSSLLDVVAAAVV